MNPREEELVARALLANAQILRRLEEEVLRAGRRMPRVCTPLELMGDSPHET